MVRLMALSSLPAGPFPLALQASLHEVQGIPHPPPFMGSLPDQSMNLLAELSGLIEESLATTHPGDHIVLQLWVVHDSSGRRASA